MVEFKRQDDGTVVVTLRPPQWDGKAGEAAEHFRAARREALLGIRTLLDGALERLDRRDEVSRKEPGSTRITVE